MFAVRTLEETKTSGINDHNRALCPFLDFLAGKFGGSQKRLAARKRGLRLAKNGSCSQARIIASPSSLGENNCSFSFGRIKKGVLNSRKRQTKHVTQFNFHYFIKHKEKSAVARFRPSLSLSGGSDLQSSHPQTQPYP